MLQHFFTTWQRSHPLRLVDQLWLCLAFRRYPDLAKQKYLVTLGKQTEAWLYPFQALLTHKRAVDVGLLHEVFNGFREIVNERTQGTGWTNLHIAAMNTSSFQVISFLLQLSKSDLFAEDMGAMLPMYHFVHRSLMEENNMLIVLKQILTEYPQAIGAKDGRDELINFSLYVGASVCVIDLLSRFSGQLNRLDLNNHEHYVFFREAVGSARHIMTPCLLATAKTIRNVKKFKYSMENVGAEATIQFFLHLQHFDYPRLEELTLILQQEHRHDNHISVAIADFVRSLYNLKRLRLCGTFAWSHAITSDSCDDFLHALGTATSELPALQTVFIRGFRIRHTGLGSFVVGKESRINAMTVEKCAVAEAASAEFGKSLTRSKMMSKLYLRLVDTPNASLDSIISGVAAAATVKELSVDFDRIAQDTTKLDPEVWKALDSLVIARVLFYANGDSYLPQNESAAICALIDGSKKLKKITSSYGTINNKDIARIIRSHQVLQELDLDVHCEYDKDAEESGKKEFKGFHLISEALRGNRLITHIGWANSRHWRTAAFYAGRNQLKLLQRVGRNNSTASDIVKLIINCSEHEADGLTEDGLLLQRHLLTYESLRQAPHLWSNQFQPADKHMLTRVVTVSQEKICCKGPPWKQRRFN